MFLRRNRRLVDGETYEYLTGPGGAGVTVSDATAQMFDPADPDRPEKAFLQEYQTLILKKQLKPRNTPKTRNDKTLPSTAGSPAG
jgi:hypothetical protein